MRYEDAKAFILDKLSRELPNSLTYHNLAHVQDVCESAEYLAALEGVTGDDLALLRTAALYHDAGFILSSNTHEYFGCQLVQELLPSFGYTHEEILRICGMIMATRIPQAPKNLLEEIICDADLDYLGRDDFKIIGDRLFNELTTFNVVSNENDWNKLQVNFLELHHYFTQSAIRLRKDKKEEHLRYLKSIIK